VASKKRGGGGEKGPQPGLELVLRLSNTGEPGRKRKNAEDFRGKKMIVRWSPPLWEEELQGVPKFGAKQAT